MLELYGTATCPYTAELREALQWDEREYVEYDVESDAEAKRRMLALCEGTMAVPVLVEDERVVQVGYNGRACYVAPA
ncbi:MAG: glutathione S-transferase N-terminal domain-containing protein [Candidatus Eremiobacteraeota bacterium]|nr:glutathione S-transferase N-terminal domain-containing protein [Candidatus Eremiobacteraeota bacterium]